MVINRKSPARSVVSPSLKQREEERGRQREVGETVLLALER